MALEFVLKLKDYLNPSLSKSAKQADNALTRMQQNADARGRKLVGTFEQMRQKVDQLRTTAQKSTDWRIFKDGMREANKLEQQLDRLERKASGAGSGGVVGKIFAAAGTTALLSFAGQSVKAAMNFGATQKSFEVLTGNPGKGRDLSNQLNQLQQSTILGPEVFKAAQTMLGFGISTEKVMPTLKMLGDVSMGDAEKFNSLTLAISQVTAAGRLQGQDLMQLVNAGWNPLQQMVQDKVFPNMMAAKEAMEKGGISAAMVETALQHATTAGGKFAGMMDQVAQTTYGKMQILQGQWENLKIKVGEALLPIADGLISVTSKTVDWITASQTETERLTAEKTQVTGLVQTITALNEKNDYRKTLLTQLVQQYPDLFKNIDIEKASNSDLLKTLNDINAAYTTRIGLASAASTADAYKAQGAEDQARLNRYTAAKGLIEQGNWDLAMKQLNFFERINLQKGFYTNKTEHYDTMLSGWINTLQNNVQVSTNGARRESETMKAMDFRNTENSLQNLLNDPSTKGKLKSKITEELGKIGAVKSQRDFYAMIGYDLTNAKTLLGGNATSVTDTTGGGGGSSSYTGAAESAMGGQKTITVNIKSFIETLHLETLNLKEGTDEIEKRLKEMFLRIVNSANGLPAN